MSTVEHKHRLAAIPAADAAGPSRLMAIGDRATPAVPGIGRGHRTALPAKPSIAVLPFVNVSGEPEQEYFTEGIADDIITEPSRCHDTEGEVLRIAAGVDDPGAGDSIR